MGDVDGRCRTCSVNRRWDGSARGTPRGAAAGVALTVHVSRFSDPRSCYDRQSWRDSLVICCASRCCWCCRACACFARACARRRPRRTWSTPRSQPTTMTVAPRRRSIPSTSVRTSTHRRPPQAARRIRSRRSLRRRRPRRPVPPHLRSCRIGRSRLPAYRTGSCLHCAVDPPRRVVLHLHVLIS